jgi:hypothetical protein
MLPAALRVAAAFPSVFLVPLPPMPENLSHEEKAALTGSVIAVLDAWGLTTDEQCQLLGLKHQGAGRRLRHFRLGNPLPDEREVWLRVGLLLQLNNALDKLFPHSAASANLWVTTPRAKLGHRTPLKAMLDGGLDGIRRVERSLDNLGLL